MTVTNVLQNQAGIQFQGVKDKSEANSTVSLNNTVVTGVFRRGRMDKPFAVTQENYRALLGHDPNNPYYLAVEDALADGAPYVWVMRIGESDYPLEGVNVLFRAATDRPVGPTKPGGGNNGKIARTSNGIRWSDQGSYLFVHDASRDSVPLIRWFRYNYSLYTLDELPIFTVESSRDSSCPNMVTNKYENVLAIWGSEHNKATHPEIVDISDPNNVQQLTLDPPIPYPEDPSDLYYHNGIQQLQFSDDGQYMAYAVYGNDWQTTDYGRIAIYKRSSDGASYKQIKRLHKVQSTNGFAFSIVGNIMRIVSNLGSYLYAYILNLDTLNLVEITPKRYEVNSGSYMDAHKLTNYQFLMESQFHGVAVITFPQNSDDTNISYSMLPGNYGASRSITYSTNHHSIGVVEGTVYYYGQSYEDGLVSGYMSTSTMENSYTEDSVASNWPNYAKPDYFNQPRVCPGRPNLIAMHTMPSFMGANKLINFMWYNQFDTPRYRPYTDLTINYLPGMEFV